MSKKKKKIPTLTEEEYNEYVLSLRDGNLFSPPDREEQSHEKD